MKDLFKLVQDDKILSRFFGFSFLTIVATALYAIFFFRNLPPVIPLFNQLTWGEQRLSPSLGIFIPDLLVLAILIVNFVLSTIVYRKTPLVSRMLAVTTFVISVLTLLFVIRTIQIVL